MVYSKKQGLIEGFLLASIYLAAWLIQGQLFLNWDASYLLHAAQLLLAGGTYTHDFFMPNPPLILYLSLPPLLCSQYFGVQLFLAFRLYIFLLATVSLALCGFLLSLLFTEKDKTTLFIKKTFFLTLLLIFLIFPMYDFGQREHFLLILMLPYLLLVSCRLQGLVIKTRLAVLIGLLAGLGFALKPQFYLLPMIVELYYLYFQKKYLACFRAETLTMLTVLLIYSGIVYWFYPDYFGLIVPYLLRNYYGKSIVAPWASLLLNEEVLFCCLPLFLHLVLYKKNPYKIVSQILFLALCACLAFYAAQQTTLYYHFLPAFSLALLLQTVLFSYLVSQPTFSSSDYLIFLLTGFLAFIFLFYKVKTIWLMLIFSTVLSFVFFGFLFTFLLVAAPRRSSFSKIAAFVFFILSFSFLCFYLAERTDFSLYQIPLTLFVLLALFGLVAPRARAGLSVHMLMAAVGLLLFIYPVSFTYTKYWEGQIYKEKVLNKLMRFMRMQPPHRVISFFTVRGNFSSPLMIYSDSRLAQRFDCLWPVAGFLNQPARQASSLQDKNMFIEMIAEDLRVHRPDFVFVDKQDGKLLAWDRHFNFIVFLSQGRHFREQWKSYHYLTTLKENYPLYELDVYMRKTKTENS